MFKDHSCGELTKDSIGTEVTLAGWVDRRRDHGGLIFIDLRDSAGITQVVFNPEVGAKCHQTASHLRGEFVIRVRGRVSARPKGTENPKLPTGEIEIIADVVDILNQSKTPPFYINEEQEVDESLRLRYRYLDLRRPGMRANFVLRHDVLRFIHHFLDGGGFMEIETPMLIKSTPEGARDYLVPSRLHAGKFYALPQSPQQMKQLLMVAGVEKYYQIARCFRDEDTRADRQPEFTQLDIEMSFVEEEDILVLLEDLFTAMVKQVRPDAKIISPFPRITYAEAMERYGSDKPDLRLGITIADLSDIAGGCGFGVFNSAVEKGGKVKGIIAPGCAEYSRHQLDELNRLVRGWGAGGLVTIALAPTAGDIEGLKADDIKSVAAKHLELTEIKDIARRLGAAAGDLLLIVAGDDIMVSTVLGELRSEIGERLKMADENTFAFAFVQDFPLLARTGGGWESMHHPFTAPRVGEEALLDTAPEKAKGRHYDIICNGYEIGGGSIRIHSAELQRKVFRLLGYVDAEIDDRFGHLLEAFDYGAPPHGGVALGLDRLVMLLAGAATIREVIAFPKTQDASDLTFKAPASVSPKQLEELHLTLREEE